LPGAATGQGGRFVDDPTGVPPSWVGRVVDEAVTKGGTGRSGRAARLAPRGASPRKVTARCPPRWPAGHRGHPDGHHRPSTAPSGSTA